MASGCTLLPSRTEETELARQIRLLAHERWGAEPATILVGRDESLSTALEKVQRIAQAEGPALLSGETGTGKELFAKAIYLLSQRRHRPFIGVNCAQYGDGHLIASELFGHKRGSFTGAVADHRGVFEAANGGVVFLDEVGELSPAAQGMLLRALGEGEILPVGDTRPRRVDVRVIAATNRDLVQMVRAGEFREDLYFRLRFLHLPIPPLRARGDDWQLLLDFYTRRLNHRSGAEKSFSACAVERLRLYAWPGNVRELRGVVEMSHALSDEESPIEPSAFEDHLERAHGVLPPRLSAGSDLAPARSNGGSVHGDLTGMVVDLLSRIHGGAGTFWELVYEPFLQRELNRTQVVAIVAEGLRRSRWSYKRSLPVFGVASDDYLKFMDFLRHHKLKPKR
jgi:transcriptional regulator with GAF, ATPase, and Fis domain